MKYLTVKICSIVYICINLITSSQQSTKVKTNLKSARLFWAVVIWQKRMRKEIESKFHKFVADRLGYFEAKHLYLKMGLPSHPVTKAFKNPENSPHMILIAFSETLDIHPYELIRDYDLGKERISNIEKEYLRKEYESLPTTH